MFRDSQHTRVFQHRIGVVYEHNTLRSARQPAIAIPVRQVLKSLDCITVGFSPGTRQDGYAIDSYCLVSCFLSPMMKQILGQGVRDAMA